MEAELLHKRLHDAAAETREIVLLLRGAHRLVINNASVSSSERQGETRLDITGSIAADGDPHADGTVSVTSADVASIFVKDHTPSP